ncbi:Solute carrier family 35 member SLC35F1/F2/F6 like protein [Aduncisulcus paluster]|uniref:Solute carrier family 35 member SLC35F1/F2/F6 like protein n=1 Tax=Aduncisulcus paluster TaxID=2918883 RepID=A0ABQ5KJG5_9EUKA|nr:Solute carrier family 35 member SLC35F1/F2/F6 like protein [Aduncisulcus paluster]
MSLSIFLFIHERKTKKQSKEHIALLSSESTESQTNDGIELYKIAPWWSIIPSAVFNLVGSCLINVGFAIGISPSIFQFLGGSVIIFSALISIIFMKKSLKGYQWYGIGICFVGLILVALSGALSSDSDGDDNSISLQQQILGMSLVVLGQIAYASQFACEEYIMAKLHASPNQIVAFEGIYGVILTLFILVPLFYLIPGDDNGHAEDFFETFIMIKNNWYILLPTFGFVFSIALYNLCGQNVTSLTTCVHRTLLEALRSVVVWVVSVIEGYTIHSLAVGETLSWWSILEALGFLVLTYGTLIYNVIVKHDKLFDYSNDSPVPDTTDDNIRSVSRYSHILLFKAGTLGKTNDVIVSNDNIA